jgi:hypothetical protein
MALQFTRNAKVYVELEGNDTGGSPPNNTVWEIPVLDGFSFSQSMNSSEITINEAGFASRRARLLFNDSLAPVEWSFSTYVRPFLSAGSGAGNYTGANVHAVEEPLWAMLMGADTATAGGVYSNSLATASPATINTTSGTSATFNFGSSNVSSFTRRWNIYISFEESGNTQVYQLSEAVCNSATIDFDIEGIATIQWSGFAKQIVDQGSSIPTRDIYEKITDTNTFIRNRLSTLVVQRLDSPAQTYNIVLTGGSITFENNISYLTPEELGKVNQPFANITGPRAISGNVTCYLDTGAQASGRSGELLADLAADVTTVRNVFNVEVRLGGATASTPRLYFTLPTAHVEVPQIGVEDLLTLDIAFHGQVSNGNVDSMNEATLTYYGV